MSGKEAIFWDSCVFISYITNEKRSDERDMAGVEELVRLIDMDQYVLVTSVITIAEVLEKSTGCKAYQNFRDFFKRPNSLLVDITRPIAEIAHDIRNDFTLGKDQKLSTPDSLQIASAIHARCSVFYTFDGCSAKKDGILQLHDQILAKYSLEICKPEPKYPFQEKLIKE